MKFLKHRWIIVLPAALLLIIAIIGGRIYIDNNDSLTILAIKAMQTAQEDPSSNSADVTNPSPKGPDPIDKEPQSAMPECTCHSKKPSMVRMHEALDGQNCGDCHKPGENLMDPNRPPTPKAEMDKRIKTEAGCRVCHLNNGMVLSKARTKGAAKIKGALFCPKCKKQVTIKDTTCGTCGGTITKTQSGWQCSTCGPLVDVDAVARLSERKPSNTICKMCHFDTRQLTLDHTGIDAFNKRQADVPGGLSNCLACHKSHNQCGGCHF